MTTKNLQYESGRSMVEMLGTLAIVGVLSVGGIAGYSYGMDKYRANTIINDIMLRAIDVNAQFDSTGDANLSEWPTTTVGKYAIGLENETIGIQVLVLPKRLCEMVFEGMINNATVKIGTTEYDSAIDDVCGDTNTMVFYVDDTASTKTEETTTTTTDTTLVTTATSDERLPQTGQLWWPVPLQRHSEAGQSKIAGFPASRRRGRSSPSRTAWQRLSAVHHSFWGPPSRKLFLLILP